jgi:predicted ATPase/DNA-binding SARP family transcriptional activator
MGGKTEFQVLGPLEARENDHALALGAPKQRAVLAVLLLNRNQVVTRERLIDGVWGDDPPDAAPRSLQVYVHGLRRSLGADRIVTHGRGYRLRVEPDEVDLERFEQLIEEAHAARAAGETASAAEAVRSALALWRGFPLAGLAGEPVAAAHAGPLEELRLGALELRGELELELGRHAALVPELEKLVREQPYRERFREQLVLSLYRCGRQKDALEALRAARAKLVEELGVEPTPALRELERRILSHDPLLAPPARAAVARVELPVPPTPLVGRRLEVAAVTALIGEGARLVTLTGPGGTGKTRLALAVADELGRERRDGAVFVDLAGVSDPGLIGSAIAETLGVHEGERPLVQAIAEHLRPRSLVLLLDNLEQLLPAAARFVAELLRAVPRLVVLATSRAPLRISGEHEYPVPPLEVPTNDRFEELVRNDAVRLFTARARAANPSFELTERAAAAVAHICNRLGGLPLAIELAAARTKVLTPEAMADRLDRTLDLLVGGPLDVPERQQTLRATLDWSHDGLGERERQVFARLGIFVGGFTADAAEAVCSDGADLLEPLTALVDVNLVHRRDGARFGMLEPIREYALERLDASGDSAELRRRYCDHFVAVAEAARDSLVAGPTDEAVYASLDAEHDNLRHALAIAADEGDVEDEVRLAAALRQFWIVRGHLDEGRRFFERVVADSAAASPALHAEALMHGGPFLYRQGRLEQAKAWWEEALEIFRERGDVANVARCSGELGAVAFSEGAYDHASALYRESYARFRELGQEVRVAIVAANLAEVEAMRGDLTTALRFGEEAVAVDRKLDDRESLAVAAHTLARVRQRRGEHDDARPLLVESLEHARTLGYREVIALGVLAAAEFALDDRDEAAASRLFAAAESALGEMGIRPQGLDVDGAERLRSTLPPAPEAPTLDEALDAAFAVLRR